MKTANELRQEKIECNKETIKQIERDNDSLQAQIDLNSTRNIKTWVGYHFESSSGTTDEFLSFLADIKKHLKQELKKDFEIDIHKGHFEFSGFAKNKQTGKWVYFSTSDLRYFPDAWYNNLLVRTAKDDKDYTGGSNCYTTFPKIKEGLLGLTK